MIGAEPTTTATHAQGPGATRTRPPGTTSVVYFGRSVGPECQKCGAYDQTSLGHKHCSHVSCPIALIEFKRRAQKRTTSLEKVHLPLLAARAPAPPPS